MKRKILLATFAAVALFTLKGCAIKCYKCVSGGEGVDGDCRRMGAKDCPEAFNYCLTTSLFVGHDPFAVERKCALKPADNKCVTTEAFKECSSTCDIDGCNRPNSASDVGLPLTPSFIFIILTSICFINYWSIVFADQ
ncbi:unnamed protein product [Clavelina lepadiformis]|uniref:Uncharacterized protein n=1 Tax=Clavelina lepadiformis TaxID=159417 RepID=A0ABP0GPW5_CLALP